MPHAHELVNVFPEKITFWHMSVLDPIACSKKHKGDETYL